MSDYPINFLIKCDDLYHNGEQLLLSDIEYDLYKTEARKEDPDNPYFKTVGATPTSGKVELPFILGSLEKKKFDGSMTRWITDNSHITELAVSDKLDGCTVYVEYNKGEVVFASTRGDGYIGHNITEKAKIFCPKIDYKYPLRLKGEVLAISHVAKDLGYKKSRTFVSGCLNRDSIKNAEHLDVVFYLILDEGYPTYSDHIDVIKSVGLPAVHYQEITVGLYPDIESVLAKLYSDRKEQSIWDIDGLVCVDMNSPNHDDEYYPTNAVAFKVNEDAVRTTVKSVEWEVKRSGKIQPVVYIEPVDISGSMVTKATGFNAKFIQDNEIGTGAEIGIVLSGEIIPFIEEVYEEGSVELPTRCPSCDAKLGRTSTNVDLICLNPDCEGKMVYRLENFLLSNGVEEVTHTTIRKLGVSSFIELMELDEFDLAGIEGFGASRVSTIISQIKKVYSTTPANLLKSFGITGLGKTMSADLVLALGDIDTIFKVFREGWLDKINIDGIGEVMTNRITKELPEYRELYDYLIENGLTFKEVTGDALKGKKITLTGKSEIKRNDLKKAIESQGGMVKGISKSVDLLFTNSPESTTVKMKKARDYGITIHGYDKLYEMLGMSV